MGAGAGQPNISQTIIKELKIPVPPLPEQKKIASLLSVLDSKIELNNRINIELEAMVALGGELSGAVVEGVDAAGGAPIAGLVIATGMSGHGFGIGPAIGRVVADLVAGRAVGHDLSRFRLSRFTDGTKVAPGPAL